MANIVDLMKKVESDGKDIRGNKSRSIENEEKISKLTTDVSETRTDVKKLKIDLELQGKAFEKGLLYYGYPTDIGGLYEVDLCVPVYGSFDNVVFGDGYQKSSHEDHSNLVQILTKLKQYPTKAFGYVPIGCLTSDENDEVENSNRTMEQLKQDVDDWFNTGVQGIFLDEYGFDYRVTRERQNEIVDYIHEKGLHVIANSWQPDYVFSTSNTLSVTAGNTKNFIGNPNGLECHLTDEDYILFEHLLFVATGSTSTKIKAQEAWDVYRIQEYYEKYYNTYHVRPFMVNSIPSKSTSEQVQEYQRLSAIAGVALCCDCVGLSAENWSSDTNKYFTVQPPQDRAKFKFINVSEKSGRPYKYQVQIDDKNYTLFYTMKSDTDTTYSNTKIYGEINGDKNAVLNPNFIEVYDSISNINSRLSSISGNADKPIESDLDGSFTISAEGTYVLTIKGNSTINMALPENSSCKVILKQTGDFTCDFTNVVFNTDVSPLKIGDFMSIGFENYGRTVGNVLCVSRNDSLFNVYNIYTYGLTRYDIFDTESRCDLIKFSFTDNNGYATFRDQVFNLDGKVLKFKDTVPCRLVLTDKNNIKWYLELNSAELTNIVIKASDFKLCRYNNTEAFDSLIAQAEEAVTAGTYAQAWDNYFNVMGLNRREALCMLLENEMGKTCDISDGVQTFDIDLNDAQGEFFFGGLSEVQA